MAPSTNMAQKNRQEYLKQQNEDVKEGVQVARKDAKDCNKQHAKNR